MDEFHSGMERLSMGAAEWKPSASVSSSDLNPESVKEFIPGRGWSASAAVVDSGEEANNNRNVVFTKASEEQDGISEKVYETTVPSGPSPPSPSPPAPMYRGLHSLGLLDDLWRYHRDIALEGIRQMDPSDPHHKAVPLPYCNAYCLDDDHHDVSGSTKPPRIRSSRSSSSSFGYPSATFQVTNRDDGHLYCLKRFDNVRSVSPKIALAVSDRWSSNAAVQDHPGIVPFYQCFLSQRAVFFVHRYIPCARTLWERLGGPLPENVVWSCVTQLVSAIRIIHSHNLAVRTLRLQHILCNPDATGNRLRLRLGSLGIVDTLEFEARKNLADLQMDDIRDLGRLILSMATGTDIAPATEMVDMNRCEDFLAQHYSRELHNLALTLIRSTPRPPSILDVSRALANQCFDEQDAAYRGLDRSERALSAEYESGRALRLLLKLGFVNERPELGPSRRWAQSGDCYILTLFRDYVFHQADGAGYPVMDLGHVVTALNKLDAADEEKIVLASRDGKSLMVVSYADVARCLESAFYELCSGAVSPTALQY